MGLSTRPTAEGSEMCAGLVSNWSSASFFFNLRFIYVDTGVLILSLVSLIKLI